MVGRAERLEGALQRGLGAGGGERRVRVGRGSCGVGSALIGEGAGSSATTRLLDDGLRLGLGLRAGYPDRLLRRGRRAAPLPAEQAGEQRAGACARAGSSTGSGGGARRDGSSGSGSVATDGGSGAGGSGTGSSPSTRAVSVTFVPHPEGSIDTVPLAPSPSQATVLSGSSLVILISPKASRCLASRSTSLNSLQSSGGDFTRVRLTVRCCIASGFAQPFRTPL